MLKKKKNGIAEMIHQMEGRSVGKEKEYPAVTSH